MNFLPNKTYNAFASSLVCIGISTLCISTLLLTGCQSLHATPQPVVSAQIPMHQAPMHQAPTPTPPTASQAPAGVTGTATTVAPLSTQQFTINGKIGITTPKQAGSAFYIWSQQGQNFAIELAGALNAGQTKISYNGQSATLTNDKGSVNAETPEALLQRATGWQVPISQLAYWIQGQPAPSDSRTQQDNQSRLISAQNGDWQAEFGYVSGKDKQPNRLTAHHPDGYKVVMTINPLS